VVDVDAAMLGRERPQAALRLLELPLESDPIPPPGLVPRDDDVHEPLEEVLFFRPGGAPCVFEGLVRGEVLASPREIEPAVQISRDRP
jgi:hypothetical protein